MPKFYTILAFVFISFCASATDPFQNESLDNDFKEINKVEQFVNENPNTTLQDLKTNHSELVEEIAFDTHTSSALIVNDDLIGIPPFWYGFCFGIIGIVLVYILTDNDKELTQKALKGCLVSAAVGVGLYIVYVALLVGLWSSAVYSY